MQKINHRRSAHHSEEVAEVEDGAEVEELLQTSTVLQTLAQFIFRPSQTMRFGWKMDLLNSKFINMAEIIWITYVNSNVRLEV